MTFLHPEFLYYMLPPLFILFGFLLTQKEAHGDFFSKEVMDKLRVNANTLTLKARNMLFFLMAFFMIIALAQPVIKDGKVEIKAKSADIMIAIDISDSMLATDVYPNRLESAKQKVLTLLEEAPNERIGIVAFAKNSYLVSPLSFDTDAVSFLLKKLDTSSITQNGTDFLSIIDEVSKMQNTQEKKILLILSDGGDKDNFSQEIELAKKHNITVFILGVATKQGAPIKLQDGTFIKYNGDIIISKLNEKMADLAIKTGGVYIEGRTSGDDIKRMFNEIMSVSEQKELKSQEIEKNRPLFYYLVAIALFILLIATSSIGKRVRTTTPSLFILFFLFFANQHAEAEVFDFIELKKAKEAYKNGNFQESAKFYEKYAQRSKNGDGYYNAANAYYKQKKYKEAIESYKKATFEDEDKRAKNFSNLGNAYAKEGDLQKAVEAYEESLKIKEDKDTRENLKEVEKLLQKQKQEPDKKSNQDKKNKDQKDSEQNKSDKDKDKEKNSDKEDKKENEETKKPSQDNKSSEIKKEEKQKNEKSNLKEDEKNKSSQPKELDKKNSISDAEEQKWIEQLNINAKSYMYKLNDKENEALSSDEKPW